MLKVLDLNLFLIILLLAAVIILYHLMEKIIRRVTKILKVKDGELEILISKVTLIIFNVLIMVLFQLNIKELFRADNINAGVIWLLIGIGFSILISLLTYKLVKNGSSEDNNYAGMIKGSPVYMFLTLLLFVGPAEDLLYVGIVQSILMNKLGWLAVPIYIFIFTFSHYLNVLNGTESKKEFLEILPVRLITSFILSMAFYTSGSLIFGFIIHNIFDTLCFLGILIGAKKSQNIQI